MLWNANLRRCGRAPSRSTWWQRAETNLRCVGYNAGEREISKGVKSKDIPLEALRAIAALVVVLNHSLDGFLPRYSGLDYAHAEDRLQGSIVFLFINVAGAVCLFFVLSGYIR